MARGRHRGPTLGSIIHRDSSGRKVGYSEPNILGGYVDYDRHGRIIGHTKSDHRNGYTHYNGWGKEIGHSEAKEYLHNPDDFLKTGSYQPNKKHSSTFSHNTYTASVNKHIKQEQPKPTASPVDLKKQQERIELEEKHKAEVEALALANQRFTLRIYKIIGYSIGYSIVAALLILTALGVYRAFAG